tara:strand:- start:1539 stop:1811 length:273 start_codon:yes stop_codon:yes gene_type:complete
MKAITFFVANVEKFAFLLGIIALMILGTSCGNRRPAQAQGKSFEVVNYSGVYVIVNDSIATFQHTKNSNIRTRKLVYKLNKTNNKYFICK